MQSVFKWIVTIVGFMFFAGLLMLPFRLGWKLIDWVRSGGFDSFMEKGILQRIGEIEININPTLLAVQIGIAIVLFILYCRRPK